jgi:hypothetical protein
MEEGEDQMMAGEPTEEGGPQPGGGGGGVKESWKKTGM